MAIHATKMKWERYQLAKSRMIQDKHHFFETEKGSENGRFQLDFEKEGQKYRYEFLKNPNRDDLSPAELNLIQAVKREVLVRYRTKLMQGYTPAASFAEDVVFNLSNFWHYTPEYENTDLKKAWTDKASRKAAAVQVSSLDGLDPASLITPPNRRIVGFTPATFAKTTNVVEIDLTSAYANAAYKLGYISEKTYRTITDKDKVSKTARLVIMGSLATKTKKTEYKTVTSIFYKFDNVNKLVSEHEAQKLYLAKHPKARLCAESYTYSEPYPTTPAQAKADLFACYCQAQPARRRRLKDAALAQYPSFAQYLGTAQRLEVEDYVSETTETRPETAPVFFDCAHYVSKVMEEAFKICGSYFFWVDALFCSKEAAPQVCQVFESFGMPYKVKPRPWMDVQRGIIRVGLEEPRVDQETGEEQSHQDYPIPSKYINHNFANFQRLKKAVRRFAEGVDLSSEQVLQYCEGMTGAQIKAALSAHNLTLSDISEMSVSFKDASKSSKYLVETNEEKVLGKFTGQVQHYTKAPTLSDELIFTRLTILALCAIEVQGLDENGRKAYEVLAQNRDISVYFEPKKRPKLGRV